LTLPSRGDGYARNLLPDLESLGHFLAICGRGEPVASRPEVLSDGPIRGEEPLGVPWRLELLHPSLPLALDQDVEHMAVLIHGSPKIMALTSNSEEHLIQMPFVTRSGPAAAQLIGIGLAELAAPLPNSLIGYNHATDKQEFLHIAVAEAETEIEPHRVADDLGRKAVVLIAVDR